MIQRGLSVSSAVEPAAVTMYCSPWDFECYGVNPFFGNVGSPQGRRPRPHQQPFPMFGGPADLFYGPFAQTRQQHLAIGNPTVVEDTDALYTLRFDLPAGIDHDGLEVTVSGRFLTIKARVIREEAAVPSPGQVGWVARSSKTESISRSFVLPEGISASSATASLLSDGKAEVRFMFIAQG